MDFLSFQRALDSHFIVFFMSALGIKPGLACPNYIYGEVVVYVNL